MANDNKTVEQVCEELRQFKDCNGYYVREIEDLADEAEAAHKREMADKDAEIARLREENEKLRAIAKEMVDKLHISIYCGTVYDACGITDICGNAGACALVAKARKMIGGRHE